LGPSVLVCSGARRALGWCVCGVCRRCRFGVALGAVAVVAVLAVVVVALVSVAVVGDTAAWSGWLWSLRLLLLWLSSSSSSSQGCTNCQYTLFQYVVNLLCDIEIILSLNSTNSISTNSNLNIKQKCRDGSG